MNLGGAAGIVQNTDFNPRLQPTSITATHAATPFLSLGYTYGTTNNNGTCRRIL